MIHLLAKSTRHLMSRIRTLIIIIVFVFGSTAVFARGGGHSGGGHGGGHLGGHGGHLGGHRGHPGGHTSDKHGRITSDTTTRGNFEAASVEIGHLAEAIALHESLSWRK